MNTPNESKYHLKSIHAEIDLFDRRLAHLHKYETFGSEAARAAAARKISLKRDPLAATAKRLAEEGVAFEESELPRSFRPEDFSAPVTVKPEEEPSVPTETAGATRSARRGGASMSSASVDWQASVQNYMQSKRKTTVA